MCISDSYTVMTYHFADAMAEVDRVAEDEGLKQSLRPVSYTHLDVYKRQSPSCMTYSLPSLRTSPFSLAAAMEPQATRSLKAMTSAPVSYTHLDVYKRQVYAGVTATG